MIDPDYRGVVNILEFSLFYDKIWCSIHERRKMIKFSVPEPKLEKTPVVRYDVAIIVEQTPAKHVSNFKLGDQIMLPCLEKDSIANSIPPCILGGKDLNNYIVIHNNDMYLNDNIFKMIWSTEGYKIKCIAKSSRCKFKVEAKPYSILPGMIIQFGSNLQYKVLDVEPLPNFISNEMEKGFPFYLAGHTSDVFIEGCRSKKNELTDVLSLRVYYEKYYSNLMQNLQIDEPTLRLQCISGPEKGQLLELVLKNFKDNIFDIGRDKKESRITLDDITISNRHCQIVWDLGSNFFGWHILETTPSTFGTYIHLANDIQTEENIPSYSHVLKNNMVIVIDEFTFRFNINEDYKLPE